MEPVPADTEPQIIGHYQVQSVLGRGAMGTVYLARDSRIGRNVALKMIDVRAESFDDPNEYADFCRRLQREAEVCGALNHPNLVTLYEAGSDGNRITYLAMEYVPGETLGKLMKEFRPGPVPLPRALEIACDILEGLDYAHRKGIIHRDIKPANILLSEEGRAKIADFGIARPQGSALTLDGSLVGTPNYMSPEQVRGRPLTPAADLFSFGVVLYEMLTSQKPFASNDVTGILYNVVHSPTPHASEANPALPPELESMIERLLAKNPDYRYASASEVLDEIETVRRTIDTQPSVRRRRTAETTAPPATADAGTNAVTPVDTPEPPDSDFATRRLDATPLTSSVEGGWLQHHVSRSVAGITLAVVLACALTPIAIIVARIDSSPTVTIPAEKLAEYRAKAALLSRAESLYENHKYSESLAAFEKYLAKYPNARAALDGRERARIAIVGGPADGQMVIVEAEKPKKPSRLTRLKGMLKGIFH